MITRDIQSIFCNRAICERLAAMLNYFLQHLVRYPCFGLVRISSRPLFDYRLDRNDVI